MHADKVISTYLQVREKLRVEEAARKERAAELKKVMSRLEVALEKVMTDTGVDSIKGGGGTVFRGTKDFVTVKDWDSFLAQMVQEIVLLSETHTPEEILNKSMLLQMLSKSVSKLVVKDYLDEFEELPRGLDYEKIRTIQIRKGN